MATGRATPEEHVVHVLLRAAYLLPILLAAVWYGVAGAALSAGAVTMLFIIHMRTHWIGFAWENVNQGAMIVVYWVTGLMTGVLTTLERRAERLRREAEERLQREVLIGGLNALEAALKSRDAATDRHAEAVALLAARIATELGLAPDRVERVRLAALVHDVGKIGVRDDILFKPGSLSAEETRRMHEHPAIAATILAAVPGTREIAHIVRAHHEYLDGSGYPEGLRGAMIPLEAQIVTAADLYCALTEDRPYHVGRPPEEALEVVRAWTPTKLRADVATALERVLHERAE